MYRKPSVGDRGKYAEKKVKEFLEGMSKAKLQFDWERIPDARTAGGRFPARAGDFAIYTPTYHGLIEAKEIEHDSRLPKDKLPQLAKLHKRVLAGGLALVLTYHTGRGFWRAPDFEFLWEGRGAPSWDLSEFPTYPTCGEALFPLWGM